MHGLNLRHALKRTRAQVKKKKNVCVVTYCYASTAINLDQLRTTNNEI